MYKILYIIIMKTINFVGTSLDDIKSFPEKVRQRIGYQLYRIQKGEAPNDWKPMKSIGQGVKEIRIKIKDQYRVIYIASISDKIYVLHAFRKKSQKTEKHDLDTAKRRLKAIQMNKGEKNG
jgi:phage-related protein